MLCLSANAPQDTTGSFCWSIFNCPSTQTSRFLSVGLPSNLLSLAWCIQAGIPHNRWRIQHLVFSCHWQLSSSLVFPHISIRPLCPKETSVSFQLQIGPVLTVLLVMVWLLVQLSIQYHTNVLSASPSQGGCGGEWGGKQKIKLAGWDKKSLIIGINKLINY